MRMKHNVLNTLLFARRDWDQLLSGISEIHMAKSGVCGNWSIKDIIAHVTWYEREMEKLLRTHNLEGSELWELEADERNDIIYKDNQFKSLDEVKKESLKTFAHLLNALEDFDGTQDWEAIEILAQNTWIHYSHHAQQIQDWLKGGRTSF